MSLELRFDVKNNASREIKKLQSDLNSMNITVKKSSKEMDKNSISLAKLGAIAITTYGAIKTLSTAYDGIIKNGLNYNKAIEQQTQSIKTLLTATSSNITTTGKQINLIEKMNLAQKESISIMKELEKINASTPQTLEETAKIYKAMLVPMRAVGAEQADIIKLTEKLAIASSSAGIEFNSLLAGVDGLASGTVLANSDLGRFLNSIGLSNDVLKESNDVVGLLNEKLKDFQAPDTIGVAISNLSVEWDKFTGKLTKDAFVGQKESVNELTELVKELSNNEQFIKSMTTAVNGLALSSITAISGTVRFINGLRLGFADIGYFIDQVVNQGSIAIDSFVLEFKKFARDIRVEVVELLGFDKAKALGVDTNFNKQQKEIAKLEKGISKTNGAIEQGKKEWIALKQEGYEFNQHIIDIEKRLKNIFGTSGKKELVLDEKVTIDSGTRQSSNLKVGNLAPQKDSSFVEFSKSFEDLVKDIKKYAETAGTILTKVLDVIYDDIKDDYKNRIKSLTQSSNTLDLQSTMAGAFGQGGISAVLDYKRQIEDINLQATLNEQSRELAREARDYKQTINTAIEAFAITQGVTSVATGNIGGGLLDSINTLVSAPDIADKITSFSDFNNEYIDGTERLKEQYIDLTRTLVDLSASVNNTIPTIQSFFDVVAGDDVYKTQEQINALKELQKYTSLDKNSILEFTQDVLQAQKEFVEAGTTLAGANDSDGLLSTTLFDDYGLAIDTLNESFTDSIGIVGELIQAQNQSSDTILSFVRGLKKEVAPLEAKKDTQIDFLKQLNEYKAGNITASELTASAGSLTALLGVGDNNLRQNIISELENVAQPQSMESLLETLNNRFAEYEKVGLPTVSIDDALSVDKQTLDEIKDIKSVIGTVTELLAGGFGEFKDFFTKIIEAIKDGVKSIIDAIKDLPKQIADAIGDFASDAGDIVGDITGGAIDVGNTDSVGTGIEIGGIIGVGTGGISLGGKKLWASGGFTSPIGKVDETGFRVAGTVHEGEWVAPKWMVDSNKSFFDMLETARSKRSMPQYANAYASGGYTTPTVNVANYPTQNNDTSESLLMRLVKLQSDTYDLLYEIKTNGVKTI